MFGFIWKIMILYFILLSVTSAHVIENQLDHRIIVNGDSCIEKPLESMGEIDIPISSDTIVTLNKESGEFVGSFRVWKTVHQKTVIDKKFVKRQGCEDVEKDCDVSKCKNGKGWRMVKCAKTCDSCHLLEFDVRCDKKKLQIKKSEPLKSGFEKRIQRRIFANFKKMNPVVISEDPLLIHFKNFIDQDSIDEIVTYSESVVLKRSTGQGEIGKDGFNEQAVISGRTSENAWCMGSCEELKSMKKLTQVIQMITGTPKTNFESAQILRYTEGQKYNNHHDIGASDFTSVAGPRVFTVFVYLTDVVDGGETEFPILGKKFKPVAGSAILWTNLKEEDGIFTKDSRMDHQANAPGRGEIKIAMNVWIHESDFKTPNDWACTGSIG